MVHFCSLGLHLVWGVTLAARPPQCGNSWPSINMDGASGLKKEANMEVQKKMHSIFWPAGTAKNGCKKTKNN